ncbi:hypothetical protein [Paraburkholderia bannensis]|uniref:hypothetical protein n=1 Tax=Paraburkholderia bannensis TaxID=765414 RepID=UPI002AB74B49|nr:hypothetical protein [Paraburkholderia bannensis]
MAIYKARRSVRTCTIVAPNAQSALIAAQASMFLGPIHDKDFEVGECGAGKKYHGAHDCLMEAVQHLDIHYAGLMIGNPI